MTEPTLYEQAWLRGPDDLLVDFDRAFRIFQEFVRGCRELYDLGAAVTVFGSARFEPGHRYYELGRETDPLRRLDLIGAVASHRDELARFLVEGLRPGDLCLTLGAGDLTTLPDQLGHELQGS